jgi:phage terminase small subunit
MLTPKQQRFVEEYLRDLNATQAALRAGYSKRTANEQAAQLMKHPEIIAAIDAAKTDRSERAGVSADWVLRRLVEEAEADLADLYDDKGDLRPIEDWPPIWRRGLVQGIEINALYEGQGADRVQVGEVKKIRISDRVRRIELIGKHVRINAFQEQVAVTGLDGLAERLDRAMRARPVAPVIIDAPSQPSVPERASAALPAAPASVAGPAPTVATLREPTIVNPGTSLPADWERPSAPSAAPAPYASPIEWPEQQGHAEADYDSFSDRINAYRNV